MYQRLAQCLRIGSSQPEHSLNPLTMKDESGESLSIMSYPSVSDHALNYIILNTGVSFLSSFFIKFGIMYFDSLSLLL